MTTAWVPSGLIFAPVDGLTSRPATRVAIQSRWLRISHISHSSRRPRSLPTCSASRCAMDADAMFAPLRPRKTKKRSRPHAETAPDPEIVSNPADNADAMERAEAILWVRGQIAASAPLAGTPAERYLVEHRGLKGTGLAFVSPLGGTVRALAR